MEKLKLGFIGSGFIANNLVQAMKQVRGIEVSAILKRGGADRLSEFVRSNNLGEGKVVKSIDKLCDNCDAAAVLAPNYARTEIVEKVIEAVMDGRSLRGIICEKPLGRTVSEGQQMVDLAREAGLLTAYFENQVHMQSLRNAKKQLQPQIKEMGPISLARCTQEHSGPHSGWFWDPTRQGGGVLLDMGCHSIAMAQYILTPPGKSIDFLNPESVSAEVSLLKWGQPKYRRELKKTMGVDYEKTPAEDYCTGVITYRNPETGQQVKAEFANSWMYDKTGLRLQADGLGPGYALELNTQNSPLEVFIGDQAAEAVSDAEAGMEKATATRGLMPMQPNEPDLLGFPAELADVLEAFLAKRDAKLNWEFGLQMTELCMAAYWSSEQGKTIDLTDEGVRENLKSYTPLIARGRGREIL